MNKEILDDGLLDKKPEYSHSNIPTIVLLILTFIGIAFKIMHWPGANFFLAIFPIFLFGYSFSGFITKVSRNYLNTVLSILGLLWFLNILYGVYFRGGYPFNEKGLQVVLIGLVISLVLGEIFKRIKLRKYK